MRWWVLVVLFGCASRVPVKTAAVTQACSSAEHAQFDFWVGDWDLVIRARKSPTSEEWVEARGKQHVERILGGCVVSEHFSGEGPGAPWAGKSYSMWQPKQGKWRQTWVDDSGSYIALDGGVEGGTMMLYGEPMEKNGQRTQMRMAFRGVTGKSIRWVWESSKDGETWREELVIEYRR
jgi:hypothetical protein